MQDYCSDKLDSSMSIKFKLCGFVMLPLNLVWGMFPVFFNQFNLQLWLCGCVAFPVPEANLKSLHLIGNDLKALRKRCHFFILS